MSLSQQYASAFCSRSLLAAMLLATAPILAGCGPDAMNRRIDSPAPEQYSSDAGDAIGVGSPRPAEMADSDASEGVLSDNGQVARKLIYTADVDLVVEEFDPLPARIEALVRQHGGFIANSSLRGSRGDRRSGSWQVRIPTEQFEAFLSTASTIGEVRSLSRRSQDVTEEYVDVEARIRNKKVQEEGLLRILEERPGKLEDVLAVERELSRVREEMERMQGRLRLLQNLTSLTTINIKVEEIRNYVPPQAPTFSRRVSRSFEASLTALRQSGEALVIAGVALAPWMIVFALPVLLVAWVVRRQIRRWM